MNQIWIVTCRSGADLERPDCPARGIMFARAQFSITVVRDLTELKITNVMVTIGCRVY